MKEGMRWLEKLGSLWTGGEVDHFRDKRMWRDGFGGSTRTELGMLHEKRLDEITKLDEVGWASIGNKLSNDLAYGGEVVIGWLVNGTSWIQEVRGYEIKEMEVKKFGLEGETIIGRCPIPAVPYNSSSTFYASMKLQLANDVELNPGPGPYRKANCFLPQLLLLSSNELFCYCWLADGYSFVHGMFF